MSDFTATKASQSTLVAALQIRKYCVKVVRSAAAQELLAQVACRQCLMSQPSWDSPARERDNPVQTPAPGPVAAAAKDVSSGQLTALAQASSNSNTGATWRRDWRLSHGGPVILGGSNQDL